MSNLRVLGTGFFLWTEDHQGKFPAQVSTTNDGTLEFIAGGKAFPHFLVLSNYVSAKVFVCPTDKRKRASENPQEAFGNQNVSYFSGLDASRGNTNSILAGH